MAPQLLEKHTWETFDETPSSVDRSPDQWRLHVCEDVETRPMGLSRVIEMNIVPRLVLAQRKAYPDPPLPIKPSWAIVEEFSGLVLLDDPDVLSAYLEDMRADGSSVEALYLGLLSATARRLGEFWENDLVDFTRVTLGLYRLQQVMRNFSPAFQVEGARHESGRHALLLSAPGEQHSFGLSMLGEFLFRAGWNVSAAPGMTLHELGQRVNGEWFSMVGLSLSNEARLPALISSIRLIRRASNNRFIKVMVGGPFFIEHPELIAKVGADGTAPDAQQAVVAAETLILPQQGGRH